MIGAESAERRADELLINLGFTEELRNRPLKALSGGCVYARACVRACVRAGERSGVRASVCVCVCDYV